MHTPVFSVFRRKGLTALCSMALLAIPAHAEGPPSSNGVISNPTLVANSDIAKAQAAGVITSFMSQGAQTCDASGKNCHSVFGGDDNMDYSRLQQTTQSLTGVQSFSFMSGQDGEDSNNVAAQTGTLALACGDTKVKMVAGVAVKATHCMVTTNGDAQLTVQVCSAPTRGNPVTTPDNAVQCSDDPSSPNFRPPAGKVCLRPACDTQPVDSLDGWSSPLSLTFQASMPSGASADAIAKNGLGLSFYPPLNGKVADFKTDSDNMTAVKVVQTFVNNETKKTAIGLKIAYRHKSTLTKDMMIQGPSAVPNPRDHTAQWDTLTKLQGNALIPKYQEKFGANGSECMQQITNGLATDGVISVCDKEYTNESGVKPIALTAKIATEGENCGTTPTCLNKVVNTNTWTETCRADVPLAMRTCSTITDFTENVQVFTRTREQEVCHEKRLSATKSCETSMPVEGVLVIPRCQPGTWINKDLSNAEFGAPGADRTLARYYCDPLAADNGASLPIQVYAHGGQGACIGWQQFDLNFSTLNSSRNVAHLAPHWNGYCNNDVYVDAEVTKTCNKIDTLCRANISFYHRGTKQSCSGSGEDRECTTTSYNKLISVVPMEFLRPGYDIVYKAMDNTCSEYEAAQ